MIILYFKDNTGYVNVDNLRRGCIEADLNLTESELREMIQEADQNGDGMIDQSEFIAIMLKTNLF